MALVRPGGRGPVLPDAGRAAITNPDCGNAARRDAARRGNRPDGKGIATQEIGQNRRWGMRLSQRREAVGDGYLYQVGFVVGQGGVEGRG